MNTHEHNDDNKERKQVIIQYLMKQHFKIKNGIFLKTII